MRKNLIIQLLAITMPLFGVAQTTCHINGVVKDLKDGQKIYTSIFAMDEHPCYKDSVIVRNGLFSFNVPVNESTLTTPMMMTYKDSTQHYYSTVYYIESGISELNAFLSSDNRKNRITGSPLNFICHEYNKMLNSYNDRILPLLQQSRDKSLSDEERTLALKKTDQLKKELNKEQQRWILENIDNTFGIGELVLFYSLFDKDVIDQVITAIPDRFKGNPTVIMMKDALASINRFAVGKPFTDFTMTNSKGKEVSLSQYVKKNKVTIVDFWASWCAPCRRAIPSLKHLYDTYKNKGLGVVGVSLDSKKESWLKAIKDLNLDYPQMSDLKGWNSIGASIYNITAIPFVLIIRDDGTIIGREIQSEIEMERLIKEELSKNS